MDAGNSKMESLTGHIRSHIAGTVRALTMDSVTTLMTSQHIAGTVVVIGPIFTLEECH
jgi:hypothetical protein